MKKNFSIQTFCYLLLFFTWTGLSGISHAKPPSARNVPKGQLPEVVIKGGSKSGVRSEKPPLQVDIDVDEPVLPTMAVEKDMLERQPESLRNPQAGFSESLQNPNVILPARFRLARNPVKVFYPLREILAISVQLSQEIGTGWEMVITDREGRPIRKFSGRGLPPGTLSWNGRSDRGKIVEVGKTYSTVINYKDVRGQARNFVGNAFSFDGVIHQESNGLILSISLPALFNAKKGAQEEETIDDSGMELLKESADWIKRYYFSYPIEVQCHSNDPTLAAARAKAVSKILASLLLLPRPEIPARGVSGDVHNQRLDIVITNR